MIKTIISRSSSAREHVDPATLRYSTIVFNAVVITGLVLMLCALGHMSLTESNVTNNSLVYAAVGGSSVMLVGQHNKASSQYEASAGDGHVNPKPSCPRTLKAVYADIHDGDKKEVTISGSSLTIRPSGNNQTWVVEAQVDRETCSASVDFNVPGKPSPPPVNITISLWYAASYARYKTEWEFTDPSGTLAPKAFPLNRWVELKSHSKPFKAKCLGKDKAYQEVFADMHDGDKKEVTISRTSVTIKPSGNNQTWVVNTKLNIKSCTANVDFNVPGKPGPPPVPLLASFLHNHAPTGLFKYEVEFTDPSGTLAPADFPLNHWVELE
jgi:hypothetical protein